MTLLTVCAFVAWVCVLGVPGEYVALQSQSETLDGEFRPIDFVTISPTGTVEPFHVLTDKNRDFEIVNKNSVVIVQESDIFYALTCRLNRTACGGSLLHLDLKTRKVESFPLHYPVGVSTHQPSSSLCWDSNRSLFYTLCLAPENDLYYYHICAIDPLSHTTEMFSQAIIGRNTPLPYQDQGCFVEGNSIYVHTLDDTNMKSQLLMYSYETKIVEIIGIDSSQFSVYKISAMRYQYALGNIVYSVTRTEPPNWDPLQLFYFYLDSNTFQSIMTLTPTYERIEAAADVAIEDGGMAALLLPSSGTVPYNRYFNSLTIIDPTYNEAVTFPLNIPANTSVDYFAYWTI